MWWSALRGFSTSAMSRFTPSAPTLMRCSRQSSAGPSGCACRSPALFAALWGMMLGFPVLRLRGDYLAIVTLAFGEIIRIVLTNWQSLTGGPNGINRIPRPSFFGLPFEKAAQPSFHSFFGLDYDPTYRLIFLYYLILAPRAVTNWYAAPAAAAHRPRLGGVARG